MDPMGDETTLLHILLFWMLNPLNQSQIAIVSMELSYPPKFFSISFSWEYYGAKVSDNPLDWDTLLFIKPYPSSLE